MKRLLILTVLILLTAEGIGTLDSFSPAQEERLRYFPETGHYVKGAFLDYFEEKGGEEVFGYPLTEEFPEGGLILQYFQRVRLERSPKGEMAKLSPLGEFSGERTPRLSPEKRYSFHHRYYPQTGHTLSLAFLEYFKAQGGEEVWGYPISEPFIEKGQIVQYLQSARLEWQPESPPGKRVKLGLLGQEYLQARGADPSLVEPVEPMAVATPLAREAFMRVKGSDGKGLQL